ncbi:hypothetical protein [Streptomyces sp. NPDC127114]|uniref:hypothetical protein n=1 Tax=Streptomyces sp. NPDC127114 TaxID=3345366 RepID=UPI00362CA6B6
MVDYNEPVRATVDNGTALSGDSKNWHGVFGKSTGGYGVKGEAVGTAVAGESSSWYGVYGATTGQASNGAAGVYASGGSNGYGIYAKAYLWAGVFEGRVRISPYVEVPGSFMATTAGQFSAFFEKPIKVKGGVRASGAYAEMFDVEREVHPGAVLVIGDDGLLAPCTAECDTRVVGVVLGDGDIPGTDSDGESELESAEVSSHQVAVALAGQVYVVVDAQYGAISPGDLLTTSPSPGCAMQVKDRARASGAIIGKALSSLDKETGVVRMLVMVT